MQNYLLEFQSAIDGNQMAMTNGIGVVITNEYKRREAKPEQNAILNVGETRAEQGVMTPEMQIDEALDRLMGLS